MGSLPDLLDSRRTSLLHGLPCCPIQTKSHRRECSILRKSSAGLSAIGLVILVIGLFAIPGVGFYTLPSINIAGSTLATVTPASPTNPLWFKHIVVIMLENQGINDVCGSSTVTCQTSGPAPYLASLADASGFSEQYTSVAVPLTSLPNYIATIGGSTFNCNAGGCGGIGPGQALSSNNLIDEMGSLSWKAYMEQYPRASGCGADYGIAPYNIGHNPFIWFNDIFNNATRCPNIVNANPSTCPSGVNGFTTPCQLISDLNSPNAPNFAWLTPNDCNNMHGSSACQPSCQAGGNNCITAGNAYLASIVPQILGSAAMTGGQGVLFITFDEGNGYCPFNGSSSDCVLAFFQGPQAKSGPVITAAFNHYSLLRTVEDNWGLGHLTANDANSTNMGVFLNTINAPPPGPLQIAFTYAPTQPVINGPVVFSAIASGGTIPYSFSWKFINSGGVLIGTANGQSTTFTFANAGSYTVQATVVDSEAPPISTTIGTSINVAAPTPQLIASFTFTNNGAPPGSIVAFSGKASGGVAPYTFTWSFGDGSSATGANVTNNYPAQGNYNASLEVSDSQSPPAIQRTSQTVVVGPPANNGPPSISISIQPAVGIVNQQVTFTASVSGGTAPFGFGWSICLNYVSGCTNIGSGNTNPFGFTIGQSGTYTVVLTVTDAASKQTTTSQTFTVQPASVSNISTGIPFWLVFVVTGGILTVLPLAFVRRRRKVS